MIKGKLKIKPLSVNDAWQGKQVKTDKYTAYEKECLHSLKPQKIEGSKLEIRLIFGLSSRGSDWDNPIKPFQDILQTKYGFNDNSVYRATVEKKIVPKGSEYVEFEVFEFLVCSVSLVRDVFLLVI